MTEIEKRPRVNSKAQQELDNAVKSIDHFESQVKGLTLDEMNKAPVKEVNYDIKQPEITRSNDHYLKPVKTIGPGSNPKTGFVEKFNERFREDYDFQKEYVHFTAYNNMITGEMIEIWTKPFPGLNCEFWQVPPNKPVWGPRYLAEQLTRARHHTLSIGGEGGTNPFKGNSIGGDGAAAYYSPVVVKETVQRLDAKPVINQKSIFMGS